MDGWIDGCISYELVVSSIKTFGARNCVIEKKKKEAHTCTCGVVWIQEHARSWAGTMFQLASVNQGSIDSYLSHSHMDLTTTSLNHIFA